MHYVQPPIEVAILVYEGVNLLNVAGIAQSLAALEHADRNIVDAEFYEPAPARYRVTLLSVHGGNVLTSAGVYIGSGRLSSKDSPQAFDTLVVPGGRGVTAASKDARIRRWLNDASHTARRICSIGSGAYILASCGLLDEREVVTHWNARLALQRAFPNVHVLHNELFARDEKYWSSAGVAATIDVALAILEEDFGHTTAMAVARHLVVFVKRSSHQSQLGISLAAQGGAGSRFADLIAWMQEHFAEPLDVAALAARAHMSARNFSRRFVQETGQTPAQMLQLLRVEAASHALRSAGASVQQVAVQCGFGDEERMRRAFHRRFGVPPRDFAKPQIRK